MNREEYLLKLEEELLLTKSKAQVITLYLDALEEIKRLNNIINKLKKNKRIKEHNNEKTLPILPPPFEYRGCFTNKKIG